LQNEKYGYIYNAWSDQTNVFSNGAQNGMTYSAMKAAGQTDEGIAERITMFEYRVKEEFYDFAEDPQALRNLIDSPELQETIQSFRLGLWDRMKGSGDFLTGQFEREVIGAREGAETSLSHVTESRGDTNG
jgi:N-sulfoglucosamine sulfohydrolase